MHFKGMTAVALAAGLALTGCGEGFDYAMETYRDVPPVNVVSDGKVWRVFDRPDAGLIMITPSLGDVAGAAAIEGATLGLSGDLDPEEPAYRAAAMAHLRSTGRSCRILTGREVIETQWEYSYRCP